MADTPARARMVALNDCASILHRHMRCAYAQPDWEAANLRFIPVLNQLPD